MSIYTTYEISKNFYRIEQDFVRCFLFTGEKEALLVDTGYGGGNLRKHIEDITKLPITVIFTHADGDHVGTAGQFEKRLMHPSEFHYYRRHANTVSMEPVWEGDILDIGSFRFEVILIPGHTPGSIALLEKEKRFLVGGDSIQTGKIYMFRDGRDFDAYRASMLKLRARLGEFDKVYASHDQYCVEPEMVNRLYTAAGKVMAGKVEGNPGELDFAPEIKCYETDGAAFYAD